MAIAQLISSSETALTSTQTFNITVRIPQTAPKIRIPLDTFAHATSKTLQRHNHTPKICALSFCTSWKHHKVPEQVSPACKWSSYMEDVSTQSHGTRVFAFQVRYHYPKLFATHNHIGSTTRLIEAMTKELQALVYAIQVHHHARMMKFCNF